MKRNLFHFRKSDFNFFIFRTDESESWREKAKIIGFSDLVKNPINFIRWLAFEELYRQIEGQIEQLK